MATSDKLPTFEAIWSAGAPDGRIAKAEEKARIRAETKATKDQQKRLVRRKDQRK